MVLNSRTEFLKRYNCRPDTEQANMKRHNPTLIDEKRKVVAKEALKRMAKEEKNIGKEPGE